MARAVEAGKLIIGAIAVCTDPTGAAAVTLGCDTILQGKAWFESKPDVAKLAKELDTAFAKKLDERRFDKPNDARTLLPQMLERVLLSDQTFVECDLDPDRIFDGFKARLKTDRAEYNSKEMLDAFEALTRPLLEKACRDKRLTDALAPLLHRKQLQYGREARDEARETNAMLSQIASRLKDSPALSLEARELAQQERLINEISAKYLEATPDNPTQALEGIAAMLERLSQQLARDETGSNFSRDFDEILREVDRLILEEGADQADTRLISVKEEIAAREQKLAAEKTVLIEKQILVAGLKNEPSTAALLHAELLEIELGQQPTVRDLEKRGIELSQEYERTGVLFDGETAVALLRLAFENARPEDFPDMILGNLAVVHGRLGEKDNRPLHLLKAIELFQRHSAMVPRNLLPDQWATTQNNLGNALRVLGGRESGTYRLEAAITAYRDALKERTLDRVPLEWANTQNNLGAALQTLGKRESGTNRLEAAVAAYQEALKVYSRDRVPLEWGATQSNLGTALADLGERENGTDRLEEAVTAYREALKESTRDRVPLNWAATQNNLGNALISLVKRTSSIDQLEEAVTAYREALKERTRDRVPLDWAMTQNNLGNALLLLGECENNKDRLDEAVTAFRDALKEFTRDRVPLQWAMTQNNLGNALSSIGTRESGTDRFQAAVTAYREALRERTRERTPLNWAATTYICAYTEAIIAERTVDLEKAKSALPLAKGAQQVLHEGGHEVWAEGAGEVITAIQAIIARLSTPNSKP